MVDKFDPANKEALLSKSRQELLDPQRIISLLPLRPYQVVGDIGCGPGFFAIALGKYLFDGKVYAIDVQKEMLDALKERLAEFRLGNVESVLSTEKKIPLDKDVLDGALIAFTLHETGNKDAFLKDVLSHIQTGGWTAILEWHKKETDGGPPVEERLTKEEARDLAEKAGFTFVKHNDLNDRHYMMLFKKGRK